MKLSNSDILRVRKFIVENCLTQDQFESVVKAVVMSCHLCIDSDLNVDIWEAKVSFFGTIGEVKGFTDVKFKEQIYNSIPMELFNEVRLEIVNKMKDFKNKLDEDLQCGVKDIWNQVKLS
jgi:hypothetical protein